MSFFRKLKAPFHDDWCPECTAVLDVMQKQLYMLPMLVGNYTSHADAAYYIRNLIKVNKKADIPTGHYACGIHAYRCPDCGLRIVKLTIFLPVREEEKYEDTVVFRNGEMDAFLRQV